ncbi:hypothetical protein [Streptomyces venezuelae]
MARCLKSGGWLLVNNSHADAGLGHVNPDYHLVAASTTAQATTG